MPGPGPFELEILDADPRRVKKLRIYRGLDRQNGQNDKNREDPAASPPAADPRPLPSCP